MAEGEKYTCIYMMMGHDRNTTGTRQEHDRTRQELLPRAPCAEIRLESHRLLSLDIDGVLCIILEVFSKVCIVLLVCVAIQFCGPLAIRSIISNSARANWLEEGRHLIYIC
jgi:hypothetical protein